MAEDAKSIFDHDSYRRNRLDKNRLLLLPPSDRTPPPKTSMSESKSPSTYALALAEPPFGAIQRASGATWGAPLTDTVVHKASQQMQALMADHVAIVRLASHISIVLVAGVILLFSRLELTNLSNSLSLLSSNVADVTMAHARAVATTQAPSLTTALLNESIGQTSIDLALPRMVVPFTAKPEEPKLEVTVYNVQVGDTVFGIAQKLGLRPETLQWSNPAIERNPDLLSVGDQLKVPPIDGAMHTVRTGDTLLAIAQRYKVKPETLFSFPANQLKDLSSELLVGQQLFIPGGEKPLERPAISGAAVTSATRSQAPWNAARGSGSFVWPAAGDISQKYWSGHRGIDISSWTGNPVVSADSGYVVEVGGGWSGGYGLHVIVDHGNGYHTLYAHLSSVWVKGGENVTQGQAVGAVGSTGNSTGPHLHFEVRYNGIPQNPFSYLR